MFFWSGTNPIEMWQENCDSEQMIGIDEGPGHLHLNYFDFDVLLANLGKLMSHFLLFAWVWFLYTENSFSRLFA